MGKKKKIKISSKRCKKYRRSRMKNIQNCPKRESRACCSGDECNLVRHCSSRRTRNSTGRLALAKNLA